MDTGNGLLIDLEGFRFVLGLVIIILVGCKVLLVESYNGSGLVDQKHQDPLLIHWISIYM